MNFMFSNFLHDDAEYANAENYWVNLFDELNACLPYEKKWGEWFENNFVNGSKIKNGNPIFCRLSADKKRGVRIIQEEPNDDIAAGKLIGAWMDVAWGSINELVICCALTEEVAEVIRTLMKSYVIDDLSPEEMKEIITRELNFLHHNE